MKNKEKAVKANPIYDIGQPIKKADLVKYLLSDNCKTKSSTVHVDGNHRMRGLQAFLESSDETEE
jgi:hypothetical protein